MVAVEQVRLLQQRRQRIQLRALINFMVAQVAAVGAALLIATLLVQSMVLLVVEL
jgi:hypothetical protein